MSDYKSLREVKRLEEVVQEIHVFKSMTLCDTPEEEQKEAIAAMMNILLVLLDKSVYTHPLFEYWPTVRDVYHGRMTAEEAIQKSYSKKIPTRDLYFS